MKTGDTSFMLAIARILICLLLGRPAPASRWRYKLHACALLAFCSLAFARSDRITIHAGRVLDGKGGVLTDVRIVVEGSKIVAVDSHVKETSYDLSDFTILPGLIDTHTHISWHFDENGRSHDPEKPDENDHSLPYAAENAYESLMAGITALQSLGSPADQALQKFLAHGKIPGPRVLTSLEPIDETIGNTEQIRERVRTLKVNGADVVKLFASKSIREGGGPTMSQEQLDAACGEAKSQGLRAVVHAHGNESVKRAVQAGCTSIEHGALLDPESLQNIAEHGVYFDPNTYLVFQNYFDNKEHFLGIGNYTEEGFAKMRQAVPTALSMFQNALKIQNLKIIFGTDAVAGAHGKNVEELIYRVEKGGQQPMAAIISATSLAAESLNLQNELGSISVGMDADLIAVRGNPLKNIGALRDIVFVMKGGRVVRYER